MTVWDLVEQRAERTPDRIFMVDDRGRTVTFAEFHAWSARVAAGLSALGIGVDSVVAWQIPSWIESLVLTSALSRLEAVQVPLLPIYREREMRYIFDSTHAEWYIAPAEWRGLSFRDLVARSVDEGTALQRLWLGEDRSLPEMDASSIPPWPSGVKDGKAVKWIYHTSGTSSAPKGARHTDRSVIASSWGWVCSGLVRADDVTALVFPVTHIGGANLLQSSLLTGCAMVVVEEFGPEAIEVLRLGGVTLPGAGQVFFLAYLEEQRRRNDGLLFPQARAFATGGAAKSPELHYILKREMGAGFLTSYGMTECPLAVTCRIDAPDEKIARTEGRPNIGIELKVVDDTGAEVPAGTAGEICVKGEQLFVGYVDEALNQEAFDDQGYLRTGDVGILDEDGYLAIVGRIKDVIIRKGENISAREIEDLLFLHPEIREVAVIGVPDPEVGERCCAVVVPEAPDAAIDFDGLASFLRSEGLMVQKIPELWQQIADLPRNGQGKVLKADLRTRYADLATAWAVGGP
jgi:acyl-CoA synthetase (AMP-forming)/AMP-acid ligase II